MLTINTFKGTEYLHLRKYYQDFDEVWKPTKDGIAMPLDFDNSRNLFSALVEILSLSEVKGVLENHFKDILDDIYL
jgi:homoserine trans-succinylase